MPQHHPPGMKPVATNRDGTIPAVVRPGPPRLLDGRAMSNFEELSEERRAEYVRLVRAGDAQSLAQANTIFPFARQDAETLAAVQKVRAEIEALPAPETITQNVDDIETQLAKVDDKIHRLQQLREKLHHARHNQPNPSRRRVVLQTKLDVLTSDYPSARAVCADELSHT